MDTKEQSYRSHIPATLWVGSDEDLAVKAITHLQTIFCKNGSCNRCTTCTQLKTQQHHAVQWVTPEKWYTLNELKPIMQTLSFALAPDELFFFIIQKAHYLTAACANSLLKSIEEPPPGYRFILLTQQLDAVLPTIRSRCTVTVWYNAQASTIHQDLFNCFTQSTDPNHFVTILERSTINERESKELFNELLVHWINCYKETVGVSSTSAQPIVTVLKMHANILPMPGSSKLFLRNLFLQIQTLIKKS